MKAVKFHLVILLFLATSVCELSAQSSGSATQTVTFGVRRTVAAFQPSVQLTALAKNESNEIQSSAVKMTVGSEIQSKQVAGVTGSNVRQEIAASDDQETNPSFKLSLAPSSQKSNPGKLVITVTE